MNIRTQTDVDRAISAAVDLHELRAGQTGTVRAPRVPNYDAHLDSTGDDEAPVKPEGDDRGRDERPKVSKSFAQLQQLKTVWTGVSPDVAQRLNDAEEQILEDLFSKPCIDLADLLAKAAAWGMVIENGGDEAHAWGDNWPIFVADIKRLAGRSA